jgi:gluconate kinase
MPAQDFLHKDAETPLCERYTVAGAVCNFSTNCAELLQAARETFLPVGLPDVSSDFSIRLWVDDSESAGPPWPQPYVRGLDHLVFAGFDAGSSMLADLSKRRVIGRFSAGIAADRVYWRTIIFPMLLSVLAGSIGLVELHAACVAQDQRGLVLIGPSRSGKSTLAMALAEEGFGLLSDDRTFCSIKQGKLLAWGMPRPIKLRREAAVWFDELRDREPSDVQNGERVFHCQPNKDSRQSVSAGCEPRLLVFLDRQESTGFRMTRMKRSEARSRMEMDLLAEGPEDMKRQTVTIDSLLELPCWRLRYGGRPQEIAERISVAFLNNSEHQSQGGTT